MKREFKIAMWILMLCALCLLAGKLLRILTEEGKKGGDGIFQGGNAAGEENGKGSGSEDTGEMQISDEQKEILEAFDAKGMSVVLDAGHGGIDPGKVGVNGAKEKEINLRIVQFLEAYLKMAGFAVTMTRTADAGLYTGTEANKKMTDMKARVRLMEEEAPAFAVSIHQNSFTKASSFGAQVFYYEGSAEGKVLAQVLQKVLRENIPNGNKRSPKANASYYLLKKSPCPLVIVECGFLSNPAEAELLISEEYQKKIAWAICLGMMEYCGMKK